jgi:hypothetical protein
MNPYAPPSAAAPPATVTSSVPVLIGRVALASLALGTVLFPITSWVRDIAEADRFPSPVLVAAGGALAAITSLCRLTGIVTFLVWFYRASRHARALGRPGLTIPPSMCVVWFFVPFAMILMPYRAMRELALASDPAGSGTAPSRVLVWWLLWLGSLVAAIAAARETANIGAVDAAILSDAASAAALIALFSTMRFVNQGLLHWSSTSQAGG